MPAEGAVGGAGCVVAAGAARDAAGAAAAAQVHLALEESLQLVDARVLVVVDPAHAVEVAHGAHVLGQLLRLWPREVVDDGHYVALRLQCSHNLLKKLLNSEFFIITNSF